MIIKCNIFTCTTDFYEEKASGNCTKVRVKYERIMEEEMEKNMSFNKSVL